MSDHNQSAAATPPATELEFEFLCVEVTRTESTELYLKVPKGWRPTRRTGRSIIKKAAKDTTDDWDWDNYEWEDTVEVQGFKPVEESEAGAFDVFDARPLIAAEKKETP